jgi:predicted carbohydrate-binding protein with CBM5 and CBM33 domain
VTATRRAALLAVAGGAALMIITLTGVPASAHGAPTAPLSRAAECGPDGKHRTGPACAAAIKASGGARLDWDNLRVAGVNGKDRQKIPDGKLCSAGLTKFAGLDLPRDDWPTTALTPGAAFTFTYRTTIPHNGTFRMYVTNEGWKPTGGLHWGDLPSEPFLSVTDPPIRDGAYVMQGKLPQRTGRALIYTIWQNSSSPDTYYSCSDVDFGGAPAPAAAPVSPPSPAAPSDPALLAEPTPSSAPASSSSPGPAVADAGEPLRRTSGTSAAVPITAGAAGLALVAAAGAWTRFRRRRRRAA